MSPIYSRVSSLHDRVTETWRFQVRSVQICSMSPLVFPFLGYRSKKKLWNKWFISIFTFAIFTTVGVFYILYSGAPKAVNSEGIFCSIGLLLTMLVVLVGTIMACGWKMNRGMGAAMKRWNINFDISWHKKCFFLKILSHTIWDVESFSTLFMLGLYLVFVTVRSFSFGLKLPNG